MSELRVLIEFTEEEYGQLKRALKAAMTLCETVGNAESYHIIAKLLEKVNRIEKVVEEQPK